MKISSKALCTLLMTLTCSCVSIPKDSEVKKSLNVLNGKNFAINATENSDIKSGLFTLPIYVKGKTRETKIEGYVLKSESNSFIPIGLQELELKNSAGKVLLKTTSSAEGHFTLQGILKNGEYFIELAGEELEGKTYININEYELQGVKVIASPQKQPIE